MFSRRLSRAGLEVKNEDSEVGQESGLTEQLERRVIGTFNVQHSIIRRKMDSMSLQSECVCKRT